MSETAQPQPEPDWVPPMLRGSLITMRRRCGKTDCRCAQGTALHEGPALSALSVKLI